ncbi:hypothetical protein LM600983_170011 [Listeria monocytogenes]|nr:hypothetical protein LM600983_170011 [Listeria monocytogenes]
MYGSKRYFELRSTRKLTSLDKKKKQARIVHSYKYCGEWGVIWEQLIFGVSYM